MKRADPNGKTIVLRVSSLLDLGTLYIAGGRNAKGITDPIDKMIAAGVQAAPSRSSPTSASW